LQWNARCIFSRNRQEELSKETVTMQNVKINFFFSE